MIEVGLATPQSQAVVPSVSLQQVSRSTLLMLLRKGEQLPLSTLQRAGFSTVDELAVAVSNQLKLPRLALDQVEIAPEVAEVMPRAQANKLRLVPVFASPTEVTIATFEPARLELFDWLSRELKRQIVTVVSTPGEVNGAIERLYRRTAVQGPSGAAGEEAISEASLAEASTFLDKIISQAVELKVSDIHIEAAEKITCVRYRIDGILRQVESRPIEQHAALVSRLKVMAQLDISERAIPQDGRIKLQLQQREIDLRISVLPTYYGEKVCCRILDNARAALSLDLLGFEPEQLVLFNRLIRAPYGLILVTGPTGSGKSTTLYAAINAIRSPELNIVSVEDPVEYQLPGINQVQVNPKRGMTFATALRSILRQDPNVILIGEIRDQETGIIAAEAALTGHLVFASLHTNDAPTAITRLNEMGIEPHLIAPSLVGVVAQRLVRMVCDGCKAQYAPRADELVSLGLPQVPESVRFSRGTGCQACRNTGYRGRMPVLELFEGMPSLRAAVGRGEQADNLRALAIKEGFKTMRHQALKTLFAGVTTSDEVIRLTHGL